MFFTASAENIRDFLKYTKNTQIQKSYDFFGIKSKNVMTFSELVRLLCRLLPCIPQSLRGSQLLHFTNSLPTLPYSNSSSLRTPSRLRRTPTPPLFIEEGDRLRWRSSQKRENPGDRLRWRRSQKRESPWDRPYGGGICCSRELMSCLSVVKDLQR